MTPEQYIGHAEFRVVESKRWPPTERPCFASWIKHRDGTVVFYLRSRIPTATSENGEPQQVMDVVAVDIFGKGCHCCITEFGYGRLMPDGEYDNRFGTTARSFRENPWGKLCDDCRKMLAMEARSEYVKRLSRLGYTVDSIEQEFEGY